jgi:hypothetical protein
MALQLGKSLLLVALSILAIGCEPPAKNAAKPAGAPGLPPPPPAAPGEVVTVTQEGSATVVRKKAREHNWDLNDAKGKYPLVVVFSASRDDQGYKKFREAWQAAQSDVQTKGVKILEVIGPVNGASGQIEGGETLNFLAVDYLRDWLGPSPSVTAVYLIGIDGMIVADTRRGGTFDLPAALGKL